MKKMINTSILITQLIISFIGFKGQVSYYRKIKDGYTTLEKAEENLNKISMKQ